MKKLLLSFILTLSFYSNAELPRLKHLDGMMNTINPEVRTTGPIFQNDSELKGIYGDKLMEIILQEAHKKASRYLEVGNTQAYYSFLVLALTVPLQEGLYLHFRDVSDSRTLCNQYASDGLVLFASNPEKLEEKYTPIELEEAMKNSKTYMRFNEYLKTANNPFFPNCENFYSEAPIRQMIRGGDGSDIGIMQVSIRWHYDIFLANKMYTSVRESVRYGLNHLMNGFRPVLANAKKYKCVQKRIGLFKKEISYTKIIRGIWAGKYNSGSIGKTCRFAKFNSPYASHDKHFLKNLNKVLKYDKNPIIGEGDSLGFKVSDKTHSILREIITNFKNKTNQRTNLESILN